MGIYKKKRKNLKEFLNTKYFSGTAVKDMFTTSHEEEANPIQMTLEYSLGEEKTNFVIYKYFKSAREIPHSNTYRHLVNLLLLNEY